MRSDLGIVNISRRTWELADNLYSQDLDVLYQHHTYFENNIEIHKIIFCLGHSSPPVSLNKSKIFI